MDSPKSRFLIIPPQLSTDYFIIIEDYQWWVDNEDEIHEWLDQTVKGGRSVHQGMMVVFKNESDLLMFTLKWK